MTPIACYLKRKFFTRNSQCFRRWRNTDLSNFTWKSQGSDGVLRLCGPGNAAQNPEWENLTVNHLSVLKNTTPLALFYLRRALHCIYRDFFLYIYFKWQESILMLKSCSWTTLRTWENPIWLVGIASSLHQPSLPAAAAWKMRRFLEQDCPLQATATALRRQRRHAANMMGVGFSCLNKTVIT